jgi:hypothetical protein
MMPILNNLINPLLEDYSHPELILGESNLLKLLTKRIAERVFCSRHASRYSPWLS